MYDVPLIACLTISSQISTTEFTCPLDRSKKCPVKRFVMYFSHFPL
jgi:hypothetical protein